MSRTAYRTLVVASVAIPVTGAICESLFGLMPPDLKDLNEHLAQEATTHVMGLMYGLGLLVSLVFAVISFYGLLRFRHWAPRLTVWTAAISWLIMCFSPPMVVSGLTYSMGTLGCALYGVAVALPYFSPEVRRMFLAKEAGGATARLDS